MKVRFYRRLAIALIGIFIVLMLLAGSTNSPVFFASGLIGAGLAGLGYLFLTEGGAPMPREGITYRALAQRLRWEIREQAIQPEQMLPSVAEYAAQYGTTTTTVRRALHLLANEGLVRIAPRVGTFVAAGTGDQPGRALPAARVETIIRQRVAEGATVPLVPALVADLHVSESTVRRVLRKLGIRRK